MKYATLVKLANVEDEATGDAFEVFEFRKDGNRRGRIKIERDKAREAKAVLELLVRKNADLPSDEGEVLSLIQKAISSRACRRELLSARCGWRPRQRSFVTARTVVGPARKRALKQPQWIDGSQNLPMRVCGDLNQWKSTVAAAAAYSAPAMLAISAAFAAPLLAFTGRQPFGVNLFGPSKIGKTTAALAGASVIGIGRESDLPNWAATHAGRGEQARIFNDMLLPINEAGLLAGSKSKAYSEIRTLIYNICEGRERRRHSASSYASPGFSDEFRTLFVSTAEHSFDQYAAIAGEQRDEGEYARCVDVPALARKGTIISWFPSTHLAADRARWARKKVIELRRACGEQHGTAFGPYIEHLIANRARMSSLVDGHIETFLKKVVPRHVEGALEHAAENFGLIYAGGCIAIECNVLPWSKTKLLRAVKRCFEGALDELGRAEDVNTRARKKLRIGLAAADLVRRKAGASFGEADHHGYSTIESGIRTYTIHARRFREWFASNEEVVAALTWLEAKGLLHPRKGKVIAKRGSSSEWAEQTPKWPNGKSVRSIVFADPHAGKGRSGKCRGLT